MNIKNLYHWENSKVISIVVKISNLLIIQQFDQSERSAISCNLCRGKSNTLRSPHSAGYKSEFLLLPPSLWIPKGSLWPDPPPRPFTWFPLITQSLPISDPPPRRVIKGFSLNEHNWSYRKNGSMLNFIAGWQNLAAFRREQKWQWKFSSNAYLQFSRQMRRFCA